MICLYLDYSIETTLMNKKVYKQGYMVYGYAIVVSGNILSLMTLYHVKEIVNDLYIVSQEITNYGVCYLKKPMLNAINFIIIL